MRKTDIRQKEQDEKIVKCGCGLSMRQKDWAAHWGSCRVGSSVPVTDDDIQALLASEKRREQADREHQEWLDEQRKGMKQ